MDFSYLIAMLGGVIGTTLIPSLPALVDLIFGSPNKKEVTFVWIWGFIRWFLPIYGRITNGESLDFFYIAGLIITLILCIGVLIKYMRNNN